MRRQAVEAEDNGTASGVWRPAWVHPGWPVDVLVCLALAGVAGWLSAGLWPNPATRALGINPTDQAVQEWFLAYASLLCTGDFDLVTQLLNAPDGINLLANASLIVLGAVLAPITLVFGAPVSFAVAVAGNLAATGIGWYLLTRRTLRLHWVGAGVGGAFAAFAPGMISQSNAHLHITAQWLVPPIVWCVHRLAVTAIADLSGVAWWRRVSGTAALLACVVTVQLFLGEEVLFFTALTLTVFCIGYAVAAPAQSWRILPTLAAGVGLAAVLAAVVLAYPLWVQFAGVQAVSGTPFNLEYFSADVASFTAYSPLSLAGTPEDVRFGNGPTELNTVFGVGLPALIVAVALWQWRHPAVLAGVGAAIVMGSLALGSRLVVNGERTDVAGPYHWLAELPLVDGAIPSRFALAMIPLIGLVLAVALDAAMRQPIAPRWVVILAVVAALVPIAPRPLPTMDRPPVPRFFTEGHWRNCVAPGGVLVPVPLPTPTRPDTMRWAVATGVRFALPQGFFIGPYGRDGRASMGTYPQSTATLLEAVAESGTPVEATDADREVAADDLAFWGASCVVLAPQPNEEALRDTLEGLLGPGEKVADVYIWRVGRREPR